MEERLIKVGITHGDINGIGYEVILKTFSDARVAELCTPVIYGSSKIAAYHRKALELPPVNMNIISQAEDAGINRVNIINCVDDETKVELSQSTSIAGEAAFLALEAAVTDLKRGAVDVLLTFSGTYRIPGRTFWRSGPESIDDFDEGWSACCFGDRTYPIGRSSFQNNRRGYRVEIAHIQSVAQTGLRDCKTTYCRAFIESSCR